MQSAHSIDIPFCAHSTCSKSCMVSFRDVFIIFGYRFKRHAGHGFVRPRVPNNFGNLASKHSRSPAIAPCLLYVDMKKESKEILRLVQGGPVGTKILDIVASLALVGI